MGLDLPGAWMLLLPVVWWLVVVYFLLRFVRALERGVQAHEHIARELARMAYQRNRDSGSPPAS